MAAGQEVGRTTSIAQRVAAVRAEVGDAARAAGRRPEDVTILLATKTQPPSAILQALRAGCTVIGENRVQEIVQKHDELAAAPHSTHFIGHLQANKINALLGRVSCVQSIDSVELARKLDARLAARDLDLDVLLQVNVSGEPSKSGVAPSKAMDLLAAVGQLPRLTVRGFMTIGLNSPDRSAVRAGYRLLAETRNRARAEGVPGGAGATELSMGMSGDFADAIAEGATMVRIGSAVFGPRPAA
jgi:PLP dependent protein